MRIDDEAERKTTCGNDRKEKFKVIAG